MQTVANINSNLTYHVLIQIVWFLGIFQWLIYLTILSRGKPFYHHSLVLLSITNEIDKDNKFGLNNHAKDMEQLLKVESNIEKDLMEVRQRVFN